MSVIDALVGHGPVVLDGAWGTELFAAGLPRGERPDLWNLTHPERVEDVALSYVEAGSRVILTNTFQSNRFALGEADVVAVARAGAEISRRAAGDAVSVFGSIGPTNTMLVAGDADVGALRDAFVEAAAALGAGGADAVVVETMSDVHEAVVAVEAVRSVGLPVVACLTFDSGRQRDRTMTGVRPGDAARILTDAGADAVGANCGMGVDTAAPICEALAAATHLPVWIKANAGLPELVGRDVVYSLGPDQYATFVPGLIDAGARFIGGCCGTTPAHIRAISLR
jgi:5-methyltetrahydrofolate--homocysteine methyltransferase